MSGKSWGAGKPESNPQAFEEDVVSPSNEPLDRGETNKGEHTRYRRTKGRTEGIRDGHLEVLADHSTDNQRNLVGKVGNPSPRGPTVGKGKPGITKIWKEIWEILRDRKPYQRNSRELRNRQPIGCLGTAKLCANGVVPVG